MMGFTFNSIHSSDYGLVKTVTPPSMPKPRYTYVKVIGKDGSYKFLDGYEDIDIVFLLHLKGGIAERREKTRQIGSWLAGENDLTLDYDSDKTYKVVLVDCEVAEFSRNHEVLRLTFRGSCVDGEE